MAPAPKSWVETGPAPSLSRAPCGRRSKPRLSHTGLLFFILLLAVPLHAKSWRIADYQDTIGINQDGRAVVRERITLVFIGEWHGIHRTIPLDYPGPRGTNYRLFVDVRSITDGSGARLKYESHASNGDRDLKIYLPDAVDTTKTVQIDYAVRNGIRFFDNYDEFYWNVTGNDWTVPIDHAGAFVNFPDNASGSLRAQAFTGAYGSTGHEATSEVKGADTVFETSNPLPMRGGLTIDVYIPKGILKEPSALTRFGWFIGSNPILLLPLVTFAVMFAFWWYKGRDPDSGQSVAPMYEPPKEISPAEAGTLIDDTIHPRDITCTIVDLAVRGYVKIEETVDQGLIFHHKDYTFHMLKSGEAWQDLAPHERVLLGNVFASGKTVRLSSLKNHFYTAIPVIRHDIFSQLRSKGMYLLDPESANGYSIVAAVVILIPFAIAQFTGYADFFNSIPTLIGAVLISSHSQFFNTWVGPISQLDSSAGRLRSDLSGNLVPVCPDHDREDRQGSAYSGCGARLSGVHEPRGCRPPETDATRHLRKISALCDGLGYRAHVGTEVRRHRATSTTVVRVTQRNDLQSHSVF